MKPILFVVVALATTISLSAMDELPFFKNRRISLATTQCYKAIKSKNLAKVARAIEEGADINYTHRKLKSKYFNCNLLQIACLQRSPSITRCLLQADHIDPNAHEPFTLPPLLLATSTSNIDLVTVLFTHPNTNPNVFNNEHYTALHILLSEAHLDDTCKQIVKRILQHPQIETDIQNLHGDTILHLACKQRNKHIVNLILTKPNPPINVQNRIHHKTPLHIACENNDIDIARALLNIKAINIYLKDKDKCTALNRACYAKHSNIINLFLQNNAEIVDMQDQHGRGPIHYLASIGDTRTIRSLLPSPQINDPDCKGYTPLILATSNGRLKTMRLLLAQKDCDSSRIDFSGSTALHHACSDGYIECVKLLCKFDPKHTLLNKQDYRGNTPLHHACTGTYLKIIEFLVLRGAQTTLQNNLQLTPLFILFSRYHCADLDDAVRQRMIHAQDANNNTSFHLCAHVEFGSAIDLYLYFLSAEGLDIYAKNKNDQTALDIACTKYAEAHQRYLEAKMTPRELELRHQKQTLHSFLRVTSHGRARWLWKVLGRVVDISNTRLPSEVIWKILCSYYMLNVETVIAKIYRDNTPFHDNFIEKQDELRNLLRSDFSKISLV